MNMWLRALLSSAIVSFVVAALSAFVTPRSVTYSPPLDWNEINKLPYEQAVALISSRSHTVRGLESVLSNLHDPWFWQAFAIQWLVFVALCFLSCCVFLFWQSRALRKLGRTT
jgi:hypothetical protein